MTSATRWAMGAVVALAVTASGTAATGAQLVSHGPVVVGDAGAVRLPDFGSRGSVVLRYDHGEEVSWAFPIRNDGPVPVTVTGVDLPAADERPLLVATAIGLAPPGPADPDDGEVAPFVPFAPFRLAPGASRTVVVHGRFDHCEYHTERAVQVLDHHRVRARVLGVAAARDVALAEEVVVRSPTMRRCPERTMDRSAHQR